MDKCKIGHNEVFFCDKMKDKNSSIGLARYENAIIGGSIFYCEDCKTELNIKNIEMIKEAN